MKKTNKFRRYRECVTSYLFFVSCLFSLFFFFRWSCVIIVEFLNYSNTFRNEEKTRSNVPPPVINILKE